MPSKPYPRLAIFVLSGALMSPLIGCSDSLPTSPTPNLEPSFLAVGKCQVISPSYADGNVTPSNVAELKYGTLLRVCCLKAGTATVTAAGMATLTIHCGNCTCNICTKPTTTPLQPTQLVTPRIIRILQLGAGKPNFDCEHDQGGG
jgi:hypothetical protein